MVHLNDVLLLTMKTFQLTLISLLVTCFILQSGIGQNTNAEGIREKNIQNLNTISYQNSMDKFNSKNLYENISGSPFYYDETQKADLVYHNGKVLEDIPFQIDLYAGEYIGTDKNGDALYLDLKYYKEIRVKRDGGDHIFLRAHPSYPEKLLQVLYQDPHFTLIKMKDVKHVQSSLINGGKRVHVNKFNQTFSYDLISGDSVNKIVLKKKKFFKAFSKSEAKSMKKYAEEQNLSLKNENDFVLLIQFLSDQLQ